MSNAPPAQVVWVCYEYSWDDYRPICGLLTERLARKWATQKSINEGFNRDVEALHVFAKLPPASWRPAE